MAHSPPSWFHNTDGPTHVTVTALLLSYLSCIGSDTAQIWLQQSSKLNMHKVLASDSTHSQYLYDLLRITVPKFGTIYPLWSEIFLRRSLFLSLQTDMRRGKKMAADVAMVIHQRENRWSASRLWAGIFSSFWCVYGQLHNDKNFSHYIIWVWYIDLMHICGRSRHSASRAPQEGDRPPAVTRHIISRPISRPISTLLHTCSSTMEGGTVAYCLDSISILNYSESHRKGTKTP